MFFLYLHLFLCIISGMKEISQGVHLFDSDSKSADERSMMANLDAGFTDQQLGLLDQAERSVDERERQVCDGWGTTRIIGLS